MNKFAFAFILFLLSTSVMAEWIFVAENGKRSVYFDGAAVQRTGNKVRLSVLDDWQSPHKIYSGHYLSSITKQEFDCSEQKGRVLSVIYFERNMRYGKVILTSDDSSEWSTLVSGSFRERLWDVACSREQFEAAG